jgi:hypothetical protein
LPCVADQLDLDVARLLDELLDEDAVVAEAVARLVTAAGEALEALPCHREGHAQALATAAGAGLDHHRVADALGDLDRRSASSMASLTPGMQFTPAWLPALGLDLVAHGRYRVVLGADEDDALLFHPFGELGVFAQKAVAGVHRLCAGLLAGGNDLVDPPR